MASSLNAESGKVESTPVKANIDLQWDILKDLGNYERHFNGIEAEYKKLASIWLLAGFAGIGFMIKENPSIGIPVEVSILGIGLATSIGIFLLWIVDLLVYHRLLDACFVEALRIEESHPELPQVRSRMISSQFGGEVTSRLRWFYVLLTAAPVLFSVPLFWLWCNRQYGFPVALSCATVILAYVWITNRMIWRDSLSLRALRSRANAK